MAKQYFNYINLTNSYDKLYQLKQFVKHTNECETISGTQWTQVTFLSSVHFVRDHLVSTYVGFRLMLAMHFLKSYC